MERLIACAAALVPGCRLRITREAQCPEGAVELIILDDAEVLVASNRLAPLRQCETEGRRFKLVNRRTLENRWASDNLLFDLFTLAGGVPWTVGTSGCQARVLGFDAGHDTAAAVSRWVVASMRRDGGVAGVRAVDGGLAEHLPAAVLDELWPDRAQSLGSTTVIRDGRVLTERAVADRPFEHAIEVVKNPRVILFRGDEAAPAAPRAGDAVRLPHGPVVLQTVAPGNHDHVHAVQITVADRPVVPDVVVSDVLALARVPTLSLYNPPRLPAPIYWADLVSKLSADGWPKAIGRGFRVPQIIPSGPDTGPPKPWARLI